MALYEQAVGNLAGLKGRNDKSFADGRELFFAIGHDLDPLGRYRMGFRGSLNSWHTNSTETVKIVASGSGFFRFTPKTWAPIRHYLDGDNFTSFAWYAEDGKDRGTDILETWVLASCLQIQTIKSALLDIFCQMRRLNIKNAPERQLYNVDADLVWYMGQKALWDTSIGQSVVRLLKEEVNAFHRRTIRRT